MLIHTHFAKLLPLFERERTAGRAVALATIVRTAGSTYRKAGAQMLIAQSGEYAGLLSGGCLEGDLREHAQRVQRTREAQIVQYDMRSADDQLFGLGAGCEGAMDILLQAVGSDNHWQPLAQLQRHWQANRTTRVGLLVRSGHAELPPGSVQLDREFLTPHGVHHPMPTQLYNVLAGSAANTLCTVDGLEVFILESSPPPRLLILGAGPDTQPLANLAHFLGWKATIYDHRPAYAAQARFPDAEQVVVARPEHLQQKLSLNDYHAVVIMSHHLESDLQYLRHAAGSNVPYVGLLGPAARRERLLSDLGTDIGRLRERLHAPVGLNIGAITPEAIALAIISEIHQVLSRHIPAQ